MKHLYDNGEGELVVANSLEDAHLYHDVSLGGEKDPEKLADLKDSWFQVDDSEIVAILDLEIDDTSSTKKTAKEWADMYDVITQVATTYW